MTKTRLFLLIAFLGMSARSLAMDKRVCFSTASVPESGVSSPVHKQRKKELIVLWPQAEVFVRRCEFIEQSMQELSAHMNFFDDSVRKERALKYAFLVAQTEPMSCERTEENEVRKTTVFFELGKKMQQIRFLLQYERLVEDVKNLKMLVASVLLNVDTLKVDAAAFEIMKQCVGALDTEMVLLKNMSAFKQPFA